MLGSTVYHPFIKSFRMRDGDGAEGDGIFQPGSRVTIDAIEVGNSGGLPTPDGLTVRLYATTFSLVDDTELPVPVIAPGGTAVLDGTLYATLNTMPVATTRKAAFRVPASIGCGTRVAGRDFGGGVVQGDVTCVGVACGACCVLRVSCCPPPFV